MSAATAQPLKKGERIVIKAEWQDEGDAALEWFVWEDEDGGRVSIFTPMPALPIQPWQRVEASMVERAKGAA